MTKKRKPAEQERAPKVDQILTNNTQDLPLLQPKSNRLVNGYITGRHADMDTSGTALDLGGAK